MLAIPKIAFERTIQALALLTFWGAVVLLPVLIVVGIYQGAKELPGAVARIVTGVEEIRGAIAGAIGSTMTLERQEAQVVACAPCYYALVALLNAVRPDDEQITPLDAAFEARQAAEAKAAEVDRRYAEYQAARPVREYKMLDLIERDYEKSFAASQVSDPSQNPFAAELERRKFLAAIAEQKHSAMSRMQFQPAAAPKTR
ncbi:hypothetical protein Msil_3113 [Methylocella silvestris BL2]|uniref:Uncharacterized protein n=1 Tax=Methylocella silvestris (strain DSM 15510 / CIP 108128 / LMG 27833 / NCIMB 13906 / BL2) TaxID=395965 RepID=B8EKZ4_METSB|nr:hypothetical protein Msil_3113 [Methylocella silvestris BL2]